MGKIEHNTELDKIGKKSLPEGFGSKHPHVDALAVDRRKQAKVVTDDPATWRRLGTNKSDLKGFDTKRSPKTAEKATRRLLYDQGVGYVEQEPDRFLREDQQSRRLLEQNKDKILDYQTFKQVIKQSWGQDTSLNQLVNGTYAKESDFKALFEQGIVQQWLQQNIENTAIPVLMRQLNIEEGRARSVWARLPARKRGKLLTKINQGQKLRVKRKTVIPTLKQGRVKLIKYQRGGKTFQRAKPVKWTAMQEKFIVNNKDKGIKYLFDFYNRIFKNPRTESAIRNKMYRIK